MQRLLLLAALYVLAQGAELTRIAVEGVERFPAEAVAKATGLKPTASVTKEQLDEACNRLLGSGLFLGCQYKYQDGVATFEVLESEAVQEVRIDLPGIPSERLWAWAKVHEPLLLPKMPANGDASQFYVAAIQRFLDEQRLPEKVVPRIETDLQNQQTILVFRPVNPAKVASVRVTGTSLIPAERVEGILRGVAVGSEYTEYDFRKLLDLNVRPLYEEMGRLNVQFPNIQAKREGDRADVTATVAEGPEYSLSKAVVTLDGAPAEVAGLPIGRTANWREIEEAVDDRVRELQNQGRLSASSKITRRLNDGDKTVEIDATITSGPLFTFGRVQVVGLSPATLERVMPLWKLREGDPASSRHASEFIDSAFKLLPQGSGIRGASVGTHVREGTKVVDYTITFK